MLAGGRSFVDTGSIRASSSRATAGAAVSTPASCNNSIISAMDRPVGGGEARGAAHEAR